MTGYERLIELASSGVELKTVYTDTAYVIEEKTKLLKKHNVDYILWWSDAAKQMAIKVAPEDELEALAIFGLIQPKIITKEAQQ